MFYFVFLFVQFMLLSVLLRCWLGGRKGIPRVKNRVVGCWHGCLSRARGRLAYGPADATATHCLASVKSRLVWPFWCWLTRVVPNKGPLNECVCLIQSILYHIIFIGCYVHFMPLQYWLIWCDMIYWCCPHSMRSQALCNTHMSVCQSHRSTAATAAGKFAAECPAGRKYRLTAMDIQQQ